ncbi:hypothetical protein DPMN_182922 [Dreissena polymorpha]|uniref:Integrase catalytic domain-containing protein n=1 Tax=Dreissena polymorpha TaxID=45954 RepID=A0A9D4DG99_DREPO|nr:hypothetical protein DPMN_182922 [Dreissena polymorpha]
MYQHFTMLGIPSKANIFSIRDISRTTEHHLTVTISKNLRTYGFQHRRVTPLHPQANSLVEAFMKPLVKALKTTGTEGIQI